MFDIFFKVCVYIIILIILISVVFWKSGVVIRVSIWEYYIDVVIKCSSDWGDRDR